MYYFRAFFKCGQCDNTCTRVVKVSVRSKFDAAEKIGKAYCHHCTSTNVMEFEMMEELELAHLEEFIQWSSRERSLML